MCVIKFRAHAAWVLAGVVFALWLADGFAETVVEKNDAAKLDYYLTDFVLRGTDELGEKHQLRAVRMERYRGHTRAELKKPYIIQYRIDGSERHIESERGYFYEDTKVVLFLGNVVVLEYTPARKLLSQTRAAKMYVDLKNRAK